MRSVTIHLLGVLLAGVPACKKDPSLKQQLEDLRNADAANAKQIPQLLDEGATPNDYMGHKPLLSVAAAGGSAEVVALLLKRGADVNLRSKGFGKTALFGAAAFGHLEVATLLLDAGSDPNAADDSGERPLREAALGKHPEMVRLLLARGADPKAQNKKGQTVADVVRKDTNPEILGLI